MKRQKSEERFKAIGRSDTSAVADALQDFFVRSPPVHSGGLYHYTKIEALKSILESKAILLSSSQQLNDLAEPQDSGMYIASFAYGRIENVAMWGIYANPLTRAVRLRFLYSELGSIVRDCGRKHLLAPVLKRKSVDGTTEFKILYEQTEAVHIAGKHLLTDVLYADLSSSNKDAVAIRWNNMIVKVPVHVIEEMKKRQLSGIVKYSGWSYEKETRICIQAEVDERVVRAHETDGWTFAPEKLALLLKPEMVTSFSVLGGPCASKDKLEVAIAKNNLLNDAIKVSSVERSALYGLIRGGVFCKDCSRNGQDNCLIDRSMS